MDAPPARKARRYRFTINYEGTDEVDVLLPEEFPEWITFVVWQLECGHENGVLHYQGYMEFNNPQTMSRVHQVPGFGRASFLTADASQKANIAYCTKEDTRVDGPWTHGTPHSQGTRTDMLALKQDLDSGMPLNQIAEQHFTNFILHERGIKNYKRIKTPSRDRPTQIIVKWGPTGTGKSSSSHQLYPNAYWKSDGKWWDDYDGHETVIWDEFYGHSIPYSYFLKLTDRYPFQVETKNGHVQFVAKTLILTSNQHPRDWWDIPATRNWEMSPLYRRLTQNDDEGKPFSCICEYQRLDIGPAPAEPIPIYLMPMFIPETYDSIRHAIYNVDQYNAHNHGEE